MLVYLYVYLEYFTSIWYILLFLFRYTNNLATLFIKITLNYLLPTCKLQNGSILRINWLSAFVDGPLGNNVLMNKVN
jgi:hypothetical protein